MTGTLYITGDAEADGLLNTNGTALLIGMLLDQQVPMEWAFAGPKTLPDRLGHLDAAKIAAMDPDEFVAICCEKPAHPPLPRLDGQAHPRPCARCSPSEYDGDAANLWRDVDTGAELYQRLRALPGYGDEKSKIFVAILAKSQGVAPAGWQEAAGKFGDDTPRSVADIDGPESLAEGAGVEEGAEGRQARQARPPGRRA